MGATFLRTWTRGANNTFNIRKGTIQAGIAGFNLNLKWADNAWRDSDWISASTVHGLIRIRLVVNENS